METNVTYISSAFVEFRELLQRHIKELERVYPERYSIEWFFLRYLRRVSKHAFAADSPKACSGAMRGLTRFYVDTIASDSDLEVLFEEVLESHRYALRMERTT